MHRLKEKLHHIAEEHRAEHHARKSEPGHQHAGNKSPRMLDQASIAAAGNIEAMDPPSTRGSGLTREEKKAELLRSGPRSTDNNEAIDPVTIKTGSKTRAEVKAEVAREGSSGTGNTEC